MVIRTRKDIFLTSDVIETLWKELDHILKIFHSLLAMTQRHHGPQETATDTISVFLSAQQHQPSS